MPQPIDLQTQLSQVTTAERIQQLSERLSLTAQQRSSAEMQEQRVTAETQVQQTHAKADELDTDLRRRTPYRGRRRRPAGGTASDAEIARPGDASHLPAQEEEHKIDIMI